MIKIKIEGIDDIISFLNLLKAEELDKIKELTISLDESTNKLLEAIKRGEK